MAVAIMVVALLALGVDGLAVVSQKTGQAVIAEAKFLTIRNALVSYVTVNGRLPCPSAGSDTTGLANPNLATNTCNTPSGTIPWQSLGISEEDALDGWGRKISYRVFDGSTGFTRSNGLDASNCNSASNILLGDQITDCSTGRTDSLLQFLSGKGLVVSNNGTSESQIAFVLISHGPSGYGAWLPGGGQFQSTPQNTQELRNTQSTGTYYANYSDGKTTDPTNDAYFDDRVYWMDAAQLLKLAKRADRNWGSVSLINATSITNMTNNDGSKTHFYSSTSANGYSFTAVNNGSSDTLQVGNQNNSSYYSLCLWWPLKLTLYDSTNNIRYRLVNYFEFAASDGSRSNNQYDDWGGLTFGILPYVNSSGSALSISTSLCGDTGTSVDIGWGATSSSQTLYNISSRFAVEFDAYPHPQRNDPPAGNHLAIDLNGTTHGVSAATCPLTPSTYSTDSSSNEVCYTGPGSSWLRNGLTQFHKVHTEVIPRDTNCSSGAAPRFKVWLIPYSVCTNAANSTFCSDAQDTSKSLESYDGSLPSSVIYLEKCITDPSPNITVSPSNAFDQIYFGITAADRPNDNANAAFYLKKMYVGQIKLN